MPSSVADQAVTALARGLAPSTVAVVGAGRSGGVGAEILRNLVETFSGRVFPVNPHTTRIAGLRCYRSVAELPESIDLAVIAVPSAHVDAAIDDCICAHVAAAVVIGAGFGEIGADGRAREAALRDKAQRAGLRIIGPNCLGVINTDPALRLNASFSATSPRAGSIALASQSGALGLAVLGHAGTARGFSSFVSTGNSADVSFADLVGYWGTDPRTNVILLYAESLPDPRGLAAIARQVAKRKPIIALKSGRSPAGARAASSHTGAMAAEDCLVDALFRDAGIIRVRTIEDLLGAGTLMASQPLPPGPRVAILTNAGGPAILAADECPGVGLQVAALSAQTVSALRAFLPPQASLGDPVDMIATASPDDYARAIPLLLADAGVDALIVMAIPLRGTNAIDLAQAIAQAARGSSKPVLATFFGAAGIAPVLAPMPCYEFPETAVRALGAAAAHTAWLRQPHDAPAAMEGIDAARLREIIGHRPVDRQGWMEAMAVDSLLEASGIETAPTRTVVTRHGAITAAREIGYPIVLKGTGATLLHKTESHAVMTGLDDEAAMLRAFGELTSRPDVERVIIQPMVTEGVEMFAGAVRHDAFGPVVIGGSGGILVELMGDVSRRLVPVTPRAASEMVQEIRGSQRLRGFRGAPPLDEPAFVDVILRLSALVEACPEIIEIDLNPVIVRAHGAVVVDARIRLTP